MAHAKDHCRVNTGDGRWEVDEVKIAMVKLENSEYRFLSPPGDTAGILANHRVKARDCAYRLSQLAGILILLPFLRVSGIR